MSREFDGESFVDYNLVECKCVSTRDDRLVFVCFTLKRRNSLANLLDYFQPVTFAVFARRNACPPCDIGVES